ncbi:hypothetical protein T439DRAFT_326390 [Meredithblackwellia eburnea MCA 4105]
MPPPKKPVCDPCRRTNVHRECFVSPNRYPSGSYAVLNDVLAATYFQQTRQACPTPENVETRELDSSLWTCIECAHTGRSCTWEVDGETSFEYAKACYAAARGTEEPFVLPYPVLTGKSEPNANTDLPYALLRHFINELRRGSAATQWKDNDERSWVLFRWREKFEMELPVALGEQFAKLEEFAPLETKMRKEWLVKQERHTEFSSIQSCTEEIMLLVTRYEGALVAPQMAIFGCRQAPSFSVLSEDTKNVRCSPDVTADASYVERVREEVCRTVLWRLHEHLRDITTHFEEVGFGTDPGVVNNFWSSNFCDQFRVVARLGIRALASPPSVEEIIRRRLDSNNTLSSRQPPTVRSPTDWIAKFADLQFRWRHMLELGDALHFAWPWPALLRVQGVHVQDEDPPFPTIWKELQTSFCLACRNPEHADPQAQLYHSLLEHSILNKEWSEFGSFWKFNPNYTGGPLIAPLPSEVGQVPQRKGWIASAWLDFVKALWKFWKLASNQRETASNTSVDLADFLATCLEPTIRVLFVSIELFSRTYPQKATMSTRTSYSEADTKMLANAANAYKRDLINGLLSMLFNCLGFVCNVFEREEDRQYVRHQVLRPYRSGDECMMAFTKLSIGSYDSKYVQLARESLELLKTIRADTAYLLKAIKDGIEVGQKGASNGGERRDRLFVCFRDMMDGDKMPKFDDFALFSFGFDDVDKIGDT